MPETSWSQCATVGQKGSENGVTIRDEEHPLGARITLERETGIAPFAITCGIHGWMVHTRFFETGSEADLQFDLMKADLSRLLQTLNQTNSVDHRSLYESVEAFVKKFP